MAYYNISRSLRGLRARSLAMGSALNDACSLYIMRVSMHVSEYLPLSSREVSFIRGTAITERKYVEGKRPHAGVGKTRNETK